MSEEDSSSTEGKIVESQSKEAEMVEHIHMIEENLSKFKTMKRNDKKFAFFIISTLLILVASRYLFHFFLDFEVENA